MIANHKQIRSAGVILCELFALLTVFQMLFTHQYSRLLMALCTIILVVLPECMERLLRCRLSLPVYIFALLYAIGPMLGHCYNLYYMGFGWDKLLHTSGGVMFAIAGLYLFDFLHDDNASALLKAFFAFCFSVALAVIWEFVEYGADVFLHTDMQQDTLLSTIHTYFLGEGMGVTGSLENITSVVVDGIEISTEGYIDIGLIDTMQDMLVETLGAMAVSLVYLFSGSKHLRGTCGEEHTSNS